MINSVNSYSSDQYAQAANVLLQRLQSTETENQKTSNSFLLDEDTNAASSSKSKITLPLEDILEEMQQTTKNPISNSSEYSTTSSSNSVKGDISSIDTDGDGTISSDEYESLMSEMGITNPMSAEDFFSKYDTDGDGEITSSEMDAARSDMPPIGPPPEQSQASSSLDTNNDGTISSEEYQAAVSKLGITDTDAADALFSKYDTNSDGEISTEELVAQQNKTDVNDESTSTSTTSSTSDSFKQVAARVLASYEASYKYMFENDNSIMSNNA